MLHRARKEIIYVTSIKNDLMYLLNILECIEKIILYSADCSDAEAFYENNEQMNFNATLNLLANMGENIGKISYELEEFLLTPPERMDALAFCFIT